MWKWFGHVTRATNRKAPLYWERKVGNGVAAESLLQKLSAKGFAN